MASIFIPSFVSRVLSAPLGFSLLDGVFVDFRELVQVRVDVLLLLQGQGKGHVARANVYHRHFTLL